MKQWCIVLLLLTMWACQPPAPASYHAISAEYVGDIHFLMHQQEVASAVEIITAGKINGKVPGDTLANYQRQPDGTIEETFNGFMCCNEKIRFDTLNRLVYHYHHTDASSEYSYRWTAEEDCIYSTTWEDGVATGDTLIYWVEQQQLVESRRGALNKTFKTYTYYPNGQLQQTIEQVYSDEFEGGVAVITKTFHWDGSRLVALVEERPGHKVKTEYDTFGFPMYKTYVDTAGEVWCELEVIKDIHHGKK